MKTKCRILGIFMAVMMVFSLFAFMPQLETRASAATTKTVEQAVAWMESKVGTALDYDGAYGAQCVDMIYYYYQYLGASPVGGNAADYAWNTLPSGWTRIAGATPQAGDIMVWTGNTYGHVALCGGTSAYYHQNFNSAQYVTKQTKSYITGLTGLTYYGVIRPDFVTGNIDTAITFETGMVEGIEMNTEYVDLCDHSLLSIVDFNGSKALRVDVQDYSMVPHVKINVASFVAAEDMSDISRITMDLTIASKDGITPPGWAGGAIGTQGTQSPAWDQSDWMHGEYSESVSSTITIEREMIPIASERFVDGDEGAIVEFMRWGTEVPYYLYLDNITFYDNDSRPLPLTITPYVEDLTGQIAINSTNFPDDNFRYEVSELFDTDGNGYLNTTEIKEIKTYSAHAMVGDFTGIEYFSYLEELYAGNCGLTDNKIGFISKLTNLRKLSLSNVEFLGGFNKITTIDLSKNTELVEFSCSMNMLESVDFSANTKLETIDIEGNNISSVKFGNNTSLEVFNCGGAAVDIENENTLTTIDFTTCPNVKDIFIASEKLEEIDLSANTKLERLGIVGGLDTIDLTKNTALETLRLNYNNLKSLDLSKNTALTSLDCSNNDFDSIDFSKNVNLTQLYCDEIGVSSLDFTKNVNLEQIYCRGNNLTEIDVSKCEKLSYLWCEKNSLTSLDVSANPELLWFYCDNNKLTELDVSNNPKIVYLSCNDNDISKLDLSKNTALQYLNCFSMKLTELDVSDNDDLYYLDCSSNTLTTLDVSANSEVGYLDCSNNKLTSLTVNSTIDTLDCSDNNLTELDLTNCSNLYKVICDNNHLTSVDIEGNSAVSEYGEFSAKNNSVTYEADVTSINLSEFEGFDPDRASDWTGCTYNAQTNTISNFNSDKITYKYDCGEGFTETFTIYIDEDVFVLESGNYSLEVTDSQTPFINSMQLVVVKTEDEIDELLPDNSTYSVFDISVIDSDRNTVSVSDTEIEITIPVDFQANAAYYYDGQKLVAVECEYADGCVVIKTNHLSKYVVAKVTATDTDTTPGDINSDGSVNIRDVVLLYQYVSRWSVTIDEAAANVNGDTAINIRDVVLLYQYVSRWDVELV